MNRREAIKSLLITSTAILVLPSCFRQSGEVSILLNNLEVSAEQEALLGNIVETLLPSTDTPGGKELQLHLFVLKMVDDCHEETDQQDFMEGLSLISEHARHYLKGSFDTSSSSKREAYLTFLENEQEIPKALSTFYKITKRRAIQGYLGSEYVMTNLVKYELVPGRYNGYMPA